MISDWLQQLDVNFPVIEPGVDGSSESDIEMRGDLFGEDLSVKCKDPKIKWLQGLWSEKNFVYWDFNLLNFDFVIGLGLVVGFDLV